MKTWTQYVSESYDDDTYYEKLMSQQNSRVIRDIEKYQKLVSLIDWFGDELTKISKGIEDQKEKKYIDAFVALMKKHPLEKTMDYKEIDKFLSEIKRGRLNDSSSRDEREDYLATLDDGKRKANTYYLTMMDNIQFFADIKNRDTIKQIQELIQKTKSKNQ